MSSYNELIALINGCINRNGVQAITGRVLNGVLRAMVNQLGAGYAMGGVAHPTDDPGTPEAPVCYYASEVGTYTHFGNIQIVPGELALLCFDLTDGWFKETMYEGFESVQATIDGNVGTPAVNVTYVNGVLSFDFSNMKGNTGAAAGFGNVTAAVDGTSGTPGVSVQTDGPDTAKNIAFQFTGLKGETGVTSVIATVDNTSGTPQCAVSLNGQQLTLAFTGLKGAQGDTGSSVAYPFTIVNNLTTNDPTQALSAAMGVQLEAEVSQLEAKVDNLIVGPKQIDGSAQDIDVDVPLSFVDGSYRTSSTSTYTISETTSSGQSTIIIDDVAPGDVYLLKLEAANLIAFVKSYFIFAIDDTTSSVLGPAGADYVELVDATNFIYKITVPEGNTKKIFSATHTNYKQNVWCKKITQSKSLEWLAVKKSNLDEEVKAALDNVLNIPASNINGNEQIVSQEDMTITFTDGTFKMLPAQTRTFADYSSSGNSLVQIAVQPGDVYYYKYYQAIQQSNWNIYFLFGQTLQMSPIFREDIPNFVELIDATNFIYKVTIPEGANYFISAVSVSYKSQIWIKKIVIKKELAWLKLSADQIAQVTKNDKDNEALWKLWDSIRKPIDFNGKSMVAFGDSITYGIASPGLITTQQSYIRLFAQYAGVSDLVVRAVSGTTLAQRGGGSDIYDRVLSYTTPADIVWIAGGTNDWSTGQQLGTFGDSDPATVYGALKGICEYLQTNYPNARVIFVTPIPYTLLESNWPNHITELNLYREAIYEVATYYGYDVVSGLDLGMPRTSGGWNNTMCADTDGCHPTERGHALYARSLAGKLL